MTDKTPSPDTGLRARELLRELLAKATKGPWRLGLLCGHDKGGVFADDELFGNGHLALNCFPPDVDSRGCTSRRAIDAMEANASLIIAAVNTLPSLLDHIDALEAALKAPVVGSRCDLCAGECRGHSLGHPEEWESEPGSRDFAANMLVATPEGARCDVESNETGCLHPDVHQGRCGYSTASPFAGAVPREGGEDAALAAAKAAFRADFLYRMKDTPDTFDFDWAWDENAAMPLSGPGFVEQWLVISRAALSAPKATPISPGLERVALLEAALERIASGEAFREMRFAEDDADEYYLRAQRSVQKLAKAALATTDGQGEGV